MFTSLANFRIEPLGEFALVVKSENNAASLAEFLESLALPGVVDVVPAFGEVAVYFKDGTVDPTELRIHVEAFQPSEVSVPKDHRVPVCYELGQDLDQVCRELQMSREAFVEAHVGEVYQCKAVGFCPGFAYLGWLSESISNLGRKATPQLRVPAGSVAIAGRMTAVYPLEKPGGWWLVGQTPLTVVDPEEGYFPISAGDSVTFESIGLEEFRDQEGQRL